jgi:hypothetical protein
MALIQCLSLIQPTPPVCLTSPLPVQPEIMGKHSRGPDKGDGGADSSNLRLGAAIGSENPKNGNAKLTNPFVYIHTYVQYVYIHTYVHAYLHRCLGGDRSRRFSWHTTSASHTRDHSWIHGTRLRIYGCLISLVARPLKGHEHWHKLLINHYFRQLCKSLVKH